jgi:hypothetical protein
MTSRAVLAALLIVPLAARAEEAKAPTVTINGMVDSYYTVNLDQPQSYASPTGGAGLYSSEPGFALNFAKLAGTLDAGVGGVKLELGFGKQGFAVGDIFVQQAYATLKLGPTTVDVGRFYTPAGFELFDSKDNWTYSRGLLYNFAVPTAHQGVRVALPLNEQLTVTGTLANGSDLWTNDAGQTRGSAGIPTSPYKTGIVSLTYAREGSFGAANFFVSKDPATGEDAWLADVVVSQEFGPLALAAEGDYGSFADSNYMGVGVWAKYALSDALRLVGRADWFDDEDGVHLGAVGLPPAQTIMSFTAGLNYAIGEHVDLRGELRIDTADEDVFGTTDLKGSMPTATIGAVAWF